MQIILPRFFIPFPCAAAKVRLPAVWFMPVYGVAPNVVVAVRALPALSAFLKPDMFIRGMIDDKIQQKANPFGMQRFQELFELRKRAVFRRDAAIIGNIISVVIPRRGKAGGKPHGVDAKRCKIRHAAQNARKVADAVPVCILKAHGVDLIYHRILLPLFHKTVSFFLNLDFSGKDFFVIRQILPQKRRRIQAVRAMAAAVSATDAIPNAVHFS